MSNGELHRKWKERWKRVFYFFPFQLLILHFKKNHFLLLIWLFLFGITLNVIAPKYGVGLLFLAPEYQGDQSFISYAILGFSLGGFFLAFNLYSYIMHGYRFDFILTLNRPFVKFSVNNFILPLTFLGIYIWHSVQFQLNKELIPGPEVAIHILGLLTGVTLFHVISSVYFITTNKSLLFYRTAEPDEPEVETAIPRGKDGLRGRIRVETYLSSFLRLRLARESTHYERQLTEKVLAQNHVNASIFEIVLIASFLFIGSFGEIRLFEIPASASIILLLTMSLMLYSALYSWFKGWTLTFFLASLILINYQSGKVEFIAMDSRAYGLTYSGEPAMYDFEKNPALFASDSIFRIDYLNNLEVLENWRLKHQSEYVRSGKKPKLIILCTSGGGSRSALWTANVLLDLDSLSNGQLLDQMHFMTGSSGGMVGAAYVREVYRQHQIYPDSISIYHPVHRNRLAYDILNPMLFRLATNDVFIRYQKFRMDGEVYTKDRGYAFERQLNENTGGLLWKRLADYRIAEEDAQIPTMVLSPTIVNDGRRMLIASRPISFLTRNHLDSSIFGHMIHEDVEFRRLLGEQNADELLFTSALRMNASFPFIMPTVSLPTEPKVEVMDAGLRDNFGIKTGLEYLYTFRNWIETNTSGVIIMQVRDKQKDFPGQESNPSLFSRVFAPLGSVYGNYTRMQDLNHEQLLAYFSSAVDFPVHLVDFELEQDPNDLISLSWHLTEVEKKRVLGSLNLPSNQHSTARLLELMEADRP